jgi:hypothetical protein
LTSRVIVPDLTAILHANPLNHRGADLVDGNQTITHGGYWLRQLPDATLTAPATLTLDHTGMRPNFLWVIQRIDTTVHALTINNLAGTKIAFLDGGLKTSVLFRLDSRGLEQVGALPLL